MSFFDELNEFDEPLNLFPKKRKKVAKEDRKANNAAANKRYREKHRTKINEEQKTRYSKLPLERKKELNKKYVETRRVRRKGQIFENGAGI